MENPNPTSNLTHLISHASKTLQNNKTGPIGTPQSYGPYFLDAMQQAMATGTSAADHTPTQTGQNMPHLTRLTLNNTNILHTSAEPPATPGFSKLMESGIYSYVQENWLESIEDQAMHETLQQYGLTLAEYEALPPESELRIAVDETRERAVIKILAERLNEANQNAIMEIIDMRSRVRAQVLGRQGISPDEYAALPPVRQAELEAQVRKEMLKLQSLLRDGYSMTEALRRLALS